VKNQNRSGQWSVVSPLRSLATRHAPVTTRRRGVGLAELLICIGITAALLTAAAVAIDASLKAYSVNQVQAETMHRARLALHRLSTYIRTSTEHSAITETLVEDFTEGQTVTDTGIALFNADGEELTFRYDASAGQLIVRENDTDHVLLRGVTVFTIGMTPVRSATSIKTGGGFDLLTRATITLTVQFQGDFADTQGSETSRTVTLSTSVTPRRAI